MQIHAHTNTQSEDNVTNLCDDSVEDGHQHSVRKYMHTDTKSEDSVTNLCDDSAKGRHQHKSYNVYSYTYWHTHMKWRKCHKPVWWFCGGLSPTPGDTWVVSGCSDTLSAHRCCAEWCGNTTQNSRHKGLGPDPQHPELWKTSCCLGAGWTVESETKPQTIIGTCTQKAHFAQNNAPKLHKSGFLSGYNESKGKQFK